jgi:hypothetical protein
MDHSYRLLKTPGGPAGVPESVAASERRANEERDKENGGKVKVAAPLDRPRAAPEGGTTVRVITDS